MLWPKKYRAHIALTVKRRVPDASQPGGKLHLEQVWVCRILPQGDGWPWTAVVIGGAAELSLLSLALVVVLPDVVGRHPRGPPVLGERPRGAVRLARGPQLAEHVHAHTDSSSTAR